MSDWSGMVQGSNQINWFLDITNEIKKIFLKKFLALSEYMVCNNTGFWAGKNLVKGKPCY